MDEQTLEKPENISVLGVDITPARIAAVLTAVAPYVVSSFDGFQGLHVAVQVALIAALAVTGITFILCYTKYVSARKVTQLQTDLSRQLVVKK